jgi:hypothetical protein
VIIRLLAVLLLASLAVNAALGFLWDREMESHKNTKRKWDAAVAESHAKAQREAALLSESYREVERMMGQTNQRIADELQTAATERDRLADDLRRRLRVSRDAGRNSAGQAGGVACTPNGGNEAPAVRVISDPAREGLVSLAEDAQMVADRLRACQGYVNNVLKPKHD